ncbi:hypothetical protein FHS76_000094 [Ochrobactrum daejeonense]|uniref:Uncharacterized protein n=1 Tax=Brucella daejeonensis TaxID=659015 RepID=A0A7W9ATI2_9HYPH|nr:hypothetical protein [Brucella daejeonensis]MBB5700256.1 hypothetical protein [Brucella daejeonensis]
MKLAPRNPTPGLTRLGIWLNLLGLFPWAHSIGSERASDIRSRPALSGGRKNHFRIIAYGEQIFRNRFDWRPACGILTSASSDIVIGQ